ncbi:MAG: (d)CMP kinase, partial [Zoogloeaceae bacterium]|nr:(d)CMP kinase [Zoogloeaceae bacterium]
VRAERRTRQLRERNDPADFSAILADLEARDARDRARPIAPLKQEADALLLDTDSLSIDEAVAKVLEWFAARHGYTEEKAAPPVPPAPPAPPFEPQAAGMPPSKMADSNKSSAPIKGADADSVVHSESAGLLDYLGFPNSRRMKRRTFWIACSLWGVVTFVTFCFFLILSIVLRIVLREPLMWVPICIYFVALIRFSILRCRDVGWEPWLVWFFSILLPITLFLFNISDNVVMNRDAESAVQVLTIIILGACGIFFLFLSLCPSKKYAPMDMTEEKTIAPPIPLLPLSETADSVRSPAPATGADAGFVNNHVGLRDYLGFPPSGRMNRLTFLIACGLWGGATYIAFYVFFILAVLMTWNPIMTVLVPVFIYFVVLVRFSILRCRDAGCTTWLVWFFSALPLATISALILLILLGEAGWHNAIFLICMIPVLSVWCVFSLCLSLWPSKTETGAQWGSAKLFLVNVVFILTWLFFLMWL